ncbi:MAG: SelB C-terminal domain-containing protein, partial [Syntrophomonas sp.]
HEMESNPEELVKMDTFVKRTGSSEEQVKAEISQLLEDDKIIDLTGKGEYLSNYGIDIIADKITKALNKFHNTYPLRRGYPREDMRSRLFGNINAKIFNQLIKYLDENRGVINSKNNLIMLANHQPVPGEREQALIDQIEAILNEYLFNPPSIQEIKEQLNIKDTEYNEIFTYIVEQEIVIKLNETIIFSARAIEEGRIILNGYFDREKDLTLASVRDLFNTSRKYALPLIEYYDRIRFTRRVGDLRVRIG